MYTLVPENKVASLSCSERPALCTVKRMTCAQKIEVKVPWADASEKRQRWSALIQNCFSTDSAPFITGRYLNTAENKIFQS